MLAMLNRSLSCSSLAIYTWQRKMNMMNQNYKKQKVLGKNLRKFVTNTETAFALHNKHLLGH